MKEHQLKSLADTGVYLGRKIHGTVEETHISWVILSRRYAFKIKKPLKFSFLDFTTLSKRKKNCEKELLLNRRFSDIYLRVVPVRHGKAGWRLGGNSGAVVDYAVMMKRMKSSKRMDLMLKSGEVTSSHIVSLAKAIGAFHSRAAVIRSNYDPTFSRMAFRDIEVIRDFVTTVFGDDYSAMMTRVIKWSDSFLEAHASRFRKRIASGFVRDVHGDLHSGNIFLYRRPVIFDCIEFNDDYRRIDVLNEIAFFCMDLEVSGKARLSREFVAEYSTRSACFEGPEDERIFTYFKCYRANVRAKVHALAAAQESDPAAYNSHTRWVKRYLLLMNRYAEGPTSGRRHPTRASLASGIRNHG